MKKIIIFFTIALFGFPNYAQVGINNTDPKASLDITATNQANPSNTDGLLIPRIDNFPTTNPTAAQQGMMVYLTTTSGTNTPGYYYWDNNAGPATWISVLGKKYTLDQAYDQGGAGAGRTITADNGAVSIAGVDGFQVTGTYNSGATIGSQGAGTRMFFNPRKRAFRAGGVSGTQWDNANVGVHSFASGYNTTASGYTSTAIGNYSTASGASSTAMGFNTTASGATSTAMGFYTTAPSYAETTIGIFPTIYTPINTTDFASTDRLFTIGNGFNSLNSSNALTIYKSGLMNINDEYNMPLTDGSANQVMATNGAGQVSFINPITIFTDTNTQNTLDQAYDEGGAGVGNTITADSGAVSIAGTDGFQVTGTYTSGANLTLSGSGTRMFFNPRKAAFRAGYVDGNQWDLGNIGSDSFASGRNTKATGPSSIALGQNTLASGNISSALGSSTIASGNGSSAFGIGTTASGYASTTFGSSSTASGSISSAFGVRTIASGDGSFAVGNNTRAYSFSEIAFGIFPTTYTPASTSFFNNSDRLFAIGNGIDADNRSNALTIYKNGLMNINDAYNMPLTDGTANQVLHTDGAGNLNWIAPTESDADWFESGNTPPNSINDNIYTYGNVGIGTTAISNAALHIKKNSTGSSPQLNLAESQANDGARINFTNSVETTNLWTLYARSDNTSTSNYFNVYNTVGGNILTIRGNGKVGINRTPNTNALEVNGQASKSSAGSWIANSDRRLKKDIVKIEGKTALDKIMKMKGVTYLWNDTQTGINRPTEIQYGFIAQELMQVFPEKVTMDDLGFYQTAYGDYDPIFVEAIKELNTKIEVLETENQQLKQQIAKYEDLETRLSALENNNIITNND